uniref:Protein kinase domain-containing protein n=1 Tax=Amorphochlora amoebiformis TaxID=1561963 RepID=A0A7S0H0U2_9EUKA
MVGATGHRSIECDSFDEDSDTISPRTRVEISQSTFIGNPVDVGATVLFRNGAAGVIALSIVSNAVGAGIAQESCSGSQANTTTSQRPNSTVAFQPQALYVDPFSIISTTASQITFDTTCATTARPVSALSTLNLRLLPSVPTESSKMIDPRPYHSTLGPWRVGKDSWRVAAFSGLAPFSGNGFSAKGYNGAFESDLWIHQWSWLSLNAFLPDNEWTGDSSRLLGGRYSSSLTLSQGTYYLLTNMFMESGTVLTIPAGTTIKAYAQDASGLAPAVVIKTGARIEATGTISSPITFTTVLPPTLLPRRGTWGGIIVLGEATVQDQAQSGQIEGITGNDGQFGGTNDDDNSGTLTYVRVWYGGADISDSSGINENEINGITFGGVGSGTKVSYCEVAYNLDDGFELFGGTVDLKYCSSVFNGDDAFDIDLGYRGRMQFLFALVGSKGDHAAEVDSKSGGSVDAQPRSFPQIYGATFVGGAPDNTRGSVVRIREGSAGIFSNMVITNGETGIENKDCGAENRTQTSPGGVADMQYLYLYDKNVVFNSHGGGFTQILLDNATCTYPEGYPLAVNTNPSILNLPYSATEIGVIQGLDPRPDACGELYRDVDTPYETTFFSSTTYKGAFGVTNWLKGLSILDDYGILSASGIPGVCQTNTGSVVSGDLIFSTATCDDLILETATAEVKAMLASYTGVAITSVTVVGQCGSIIFQYSVAFAAGQVSEANAFATEFVDAPSSVLGANIVTMYGPPVATAQNFIGDDTQPTPAPTQSPTLPPTPEPQAKHIVDRTKETAFMALMIVFFVFTIPAAIGLYMSLKMERKYVKRQMDKWWALALEGNKSNIEIPEEIDIFKKIQDEDASEWIKLFVEFHFKITTNAKLKKLLVTHGRNWKIAMFRFLNQRLVQEEDFQIVDECAIRHNTNTKIKLFKAGFLTQAVLTMAEIDADMFIQYSNKRDKRLYDSLRLIKEATKHGSSDQERTIKGLLLYAILNKISNYICKSSAVEIASHLSIGQWAKMTKLLRVTLRAVCTPTKDEKLFVIHVDPSGIKFSTERLCNTASALLNGGAVRDLISDAAVKRQILESSSRTAKHDIQVRAAALRTYKECFDSISKLMDFSKIEMKHILKERKKHRVQGRRRERKALKDSFLSPGSAENQCLNACVDALSTTKEFKGRIEAIENSLIFSIGTLEAANNKAMAGLHKIAARTLGGHGGETAGMGDIRLLMPQQVAEISKQLVIANRTKTNIYRAYMSGVKIAVRVLDVGSIRGPIKQAILRHQKLSHTPFVVQLFGVGFSRKHGWFIAMEYIEKTLNDILNAWPPLLLDIRMQIAADIASALQYLHTARVHHGNINPFTILVTNSLQIKITDFTLSTDLDDDEKNNTYVGTFQTISAGTTSVSTGSTMGNSYFKAPEVHVQIPAQNFVLSPQSIMKLDVFSFGAVLTELLSGAGARLSSVLPSDLPALYYQFLKQAGAISSPTTTGEIKATDELSPSPEEIKKAKLVATSVVLSKDKQFEIAFDLEPFQLPNVVVPIVEKMISLKAENRPDMKLVRERIVRLKNRVKAGTEEKLNMQYLKAEHIQEIEKHLIFNNRLKNTKNVYKISLFGLDVVVKLLGSENWSEEVKLHHQVSRDNPHVVDMFGCGFSHKMGWFLCMEYVQYTLSDLIFAAAPPPDSTLLQMAIDMVDGFAMLHAKGISHRDVKPLNILVTSDFKIRICDFGISTKMRRKESIDVGNFTQQQLQEMQHAGIKAAVGTPVYMAPEQHIRKDKELSRKASEMVDVYGFGVCLLEMFGGIPLKDLLPLQVDLYYKQRNCKGRDMAVELPKQNKMRRIPGPVMVIIRGCMSWDPSFRPTMDRVKIALEAFQKSAEGAKMELRRQLSTKHNARNYGIGMGESARLYQSGLKPGGGLVSAPDVIQTNSLMSPPITPANVLRAGRSASMMQIMSKETLMALSQMAPDLAIDIKPEGKPETEVKASRRASAVRKGKGNQPEQTEIGERETSITRSRIRPVSTVRPDFAETPHGSELRFYEDANQPLV